MNRDQMLARATQKGKIFDIAIIGGGSSGVGCAIDAARRGLSVILLEALDFGKGTSSRSTKLVHGGVRYLAQGNISLVSEALEERGRLLKNAPHLVEKRAFVVPCYSLADRIFYGAGLKTYDILAGKFSFGASRLLSKEKTLQLLPNIAPKGLKGGILYFDGQFDDSRLLINLVRTAAENDVAILNYARVFEFAKDKKGKISGANFIDEESGQLFHVEAKAFINAAGVFGDGVRKLADSQSGTIIAPSQGIHLVFDKKFLRGENALMIPKTADGRVLFAIPWHNKTLVGTTDTPLEKISAEPIALKSEIDFILQTCAEYFAEKPSREDILSIFAGIRPLVSAKDVKTTAALSREHLILREDSGLFSLIGGKWTTYRQMAEDCVDKIVADEDLTAGKCTTADLKIHGADSDSKTVEKWREYGSDAKFIEEIIAKNPSMNAPLHEKYEMTRAEIVYFVRFEMARTVEDVLARRFRLLFFDARAAIESAETCAEIIAEELGRDKFWIRTEVETFQKIAENYLPN